jgi:tripartite ATP-independent transporter DctM subunit
MKILRVFAVLALVLMSLLPVGEMVARLFGLTGIPGAIVCVQHLTLFVAFLGAALAASSDRLLSMSANTLLPASWLPRARVFVFAVAAAVTVSLAWAGVGFVLAEREGGAILTLGLPRWPVQAIMPVGFLLIAGFGIWKVADSWKPRLAAALGLLVPLLFLLAPAGAGLLWAGVAILLAAALLGMPIFATLGGLALILYWHGGIPVATLPVDMYRLVVSPVLPSLPLFTFAGYLLAEGGASQRLLRVYSALFGWMPGGLVITTAVVCAIFTWAGSGLTILSLGGLLVPMLIKGGYPERFSIGMINASGSLGLLFPPSLPVILYGIYSKTSIEDLFIGGFLPGMLMIALVCAWGVYQGYRHKATRTRFSWKEAVLATWVAKWELAIPVIVLLGLFGGFGTLMEAGAFAVVYAYVVECLGYRGFSPVRDLIRIAGECAIVIGGVLMIIGVAVGLTNYLVDAQAPALMIEWARTHIHSKYAFLLLLNLLLLVKGSFMDVFAAIIILVPILTPVAEGFGIHPVQLGIIFLSNLELGYLTPPVGINLCLSAYRFKKPMSSIYMATLPFYVILLVGVLLITYIPALTMAPLAWMGR